MKCRNGFVSNSSSTSFTLVTSKKSYDEAIKNLHPYIQAGLNSIKEDKRFEGKDMVLLTRFVDRYASFEGFSRRFTYDGEQVMNPDDEDYPLPIADAVEWLRDELKKIDKDFIYDRESY